MLTNLYIENIAVIEKSNVDFFQGLNVLTGETGAGKSIIIDAINAVLGNRTSKDLIRSGCENAYVSAVFSDVNSSVKRLLEENGFGSDEDLMIQREINLSGKGKCRINGRPATVSMLKLIGTGLINIHGQHESYELMSPELHITYIDKLGELDEALKDYQTAFSKYKVLRSELDKAQLDEAERARRIDLLRYQVDELERADLYIGELEELTEQRNILENKEKIASSLNKTKELLNGGDESDGAIQLLESACDALGNITDVLPETNSLFQRLQNAVYELEDCCSEVSGLWDSADGDMYDPEAIEDRIDLIHRLGRKYGPTIEEMLKYLEQSRNELSFLEKLEENRESLEQELNEAYRQALRLANDLSEKRKEVSSDFSLKVRKEMTFLDMPNVELVVRQERCELNSFGCDEIELLISTNPGEQPKPVAKIASGGELSRMMLAIKNVLADKDEIDTLIFDEVDTGISGSASQKVGLKLKEVSKNRQVLCVTHQAQIASLADRHFKISKMVSEGKTYTGVEMLDYEGRKNEIARIIGGVEITKATLDYAEEMLRHGN